MWNVSSSNEYDSWFSTLLTGGDKKGKDQKKFYKDLIKESEEIIEKHEQDILNNENQEEKK